MEQPLSSSWTRPILTPKLFVRILSHGLPKVWLLACNCVKFYLSDCELISTSDVFYLFCNAMDWKLLCDFFALSITVKYTTYYPALELHFFLPGLIWEFRFHSCITKMAFPCSLLYVIPTVWFITSQNEQNSLHKCS